LLVLLEELLASLLARDYANNHQLNYAHRLQQQDSLWTRDGIGYREILL